jgi:hypothetical protein
MTFLVLLSGRRRSVTVYTVKKGYRFSRTRTGCHQPNSLWPVRIDLFLPRDSVVSDIPAGDGKIINLFLQCNTFVLVARTFSDQAETVSTAILSV